VRVTPPLGWSTWPITALPSGPARAGDLLGGGEAVHRDLLAVPLAHRLQCDPGARALHIHKQTLGYRIRKIEQLTGRVR
jgi:hypothetical protein